jgi:transposase
MSDAAQGRDLGLSRNTVRKWREAFQGGGIQALRDRPRSGRKRTISVAIERAIFAAHKSGASCWAVAEECNVGAATVHKIVKKLRAQD